MPFTLLSDDEKVRLAPELVGSIAVVVTDGLKHWVVKPRNVATNEEKRDYLGYLLGNKFANIAEVKLLTPEEHSQIKTLSGRGDDSTPANTYLVRLAGSYSLDELPCKTAEEAVAAELVYSTWIRRRDAHVDNRCYINGVPIFFDHHVAFGAEGVSTAEAFFTAADSYGHATFWRVKEIADQMTTQKARAVDRNLAGAHHYVNNLEEFKNQVDKKVRELPVILGNDWKTLIATSGFVAEDTESIYLILKNDLDNLEQDIARMNQTIFQS